MAWLPSYFELALGLDVQNSSLLTLIPYLAMTAMTPLVSTYPPDFLVSAIVPPLPFRHDCPASWTFTVTQPMCRWAQLRMALWRRAGRSQTSENSARHARWSLKPYGMVTQCNRASVVVLRPHTKSSEVTSLDPAGHCVPGSSAVHDRVRRADARPQRRDAAAHRDHRGPALSLLRAGSVEPGRPVL